MKKAFILLIALLILSNIYVHYTMKQDEAPEAVKVAAPVAQDFSKIAVPTPFEVGETAYVWSEERGEIVVPEINLWAKPGHLTVSHQKVIGVMKHNTLITITGKQYSSEDGSWYFLIEDIKGKRRGWVSAILLKKEGRQWKIKKIH